MTQHRNAAAAAPTIAHDRHHELFEDLMSAVARGFPRRETRSTFRHLTEGLLMELEDVNCWTPEERAVHQRSY